MNILELHVCHRELGMLDNLIEDYQLSASSWTHYHTPGMARQYLSGWCADTTDINPYLQVVQHHFSLENSIKSYLNTIQSVNDVL